MSETETFVGPALMWTVVLWTQKYCSESGGRLTSRRINKAIAGPKMTEPQNNQIQAYPAVS